MRNPNCVFGLHLKNLSYNDFIKIVTKSILVIHPDGKEINFVDIEDIPEDSQIKLELYNDIQVFIDNEIKTGVFIISSYMFIDGDIRFTFIDNPKIVIGKGTCCEYMIHFQNPEDGFSKTVFEEKDILDLLKWKNTLIEENRIKCEYNLELLTYCCS